MAFARARPVPLSLLDDAAARRMNLRQLRELVQLWIDERPNDPVPRKLDPIVELLAR